MAHAALASETRAVKTTSWRRAQSLCFEVFLRGGIFFLDDRSERRNRLTPEQTNTGLRAVGDLDPEVDALVQDHAVLDLARRHQLTAYDAACLEPAIRIGATLATLDTRLDQAAKARELVVTAPPL